MKKKYVAYVTYSGRGEDSEKTGVYSREIDARERAELRGDCVVVFRTDDVRDLEDIIEDNLTDEQANEYQS